MLGLKLPTDPRWVNIAEKSIDEILIDHAFCEQKAATSGISLIIRYPDYPSVVDQVTPLVSEEWAHFRMVLKEMKKRGIMLGKQRKDEYVSQLLQFQRKGGSRDQQLLEILLTNALIEARSCERFRLLSLHIDDEYLRKFYHEFMVSEAGHYTMFIGLANEYLPAETVRQRWEEYLDFEAGVISKLQWRGDRVH
jgi:tRNA 2-(methylsulfanyl)-N6-isopentenyladenosine37 hydroxylase